MMISTASWQRAFVLHRRPYSESSLTLDVLTEGEGRVQMLAKGARRHRSSLKGYLQPFTPLLLRWSGKSALKTLSHAEPVAAAFPLTGSMLYSGLYINELLLRVLEDGTNYSALFFAYLDCLQALAGADTPPEAALRQFELSLLTSLGYGVDFLHCAGSGQAVSAMMTYRYCAEQGFIVSLLSDHYSFTGRELHSLAARNFTDEHALRTAKRFTRMALKPYLRGKPLKSRELFRYVNKSTRQYG